MPLPLRTPFRSLTLPVMTTARDPELIRIGAAIRDWRERRGEPQRQVAERAEIHPKTLQKVESGSLAASRILYLRIADALDISVEDMDALTGQEANV